MRQAIERLRQVAVVAPAHAVQDVNDLFQHELKSGDRIAIGVARRIGSWGFVIGQSLFLSGWAGLNIVGWARHWDPYPFIMMSLLLSIQAAFTGPLIMMA